MQRCSFLQNYSDSSGTGITLAEGPSQVEQRRFSLRVMRDFGIGTKSIESRIQDDLLEFLDKIQNREGEAIEHKRIFNAHIVSTLWSVIMTDKLEKTKLDELAYIFQEK